MWVLSVDMQTFRLYSISWHTRHGPLGVRYSSFPDSLFQVLNVVNTNTVDDFLHIPSEIKI
jgi:hypothetical protein